MSTFQEVTAKKYKDQAIFFLNAFWAEAGSDAEKIWEQYHLVCELDVENKEEGFKLDEFQAHRFFEKEGIAMSVQEMRQTLHVQDPKFKKIAFIEFLLFKYKQTIEELMTRPQGTCDNPEVIKAQQALEEVQKVIRGIENKKAELSQKSKGTGVAAMRAKAELEQLCSGDNTELNKALITAEAQVRKVQKLTGCTGSIAAQGMMWWMNRELEEAKKYKPQRQGGHK